MTTDTVRLTECPNCHGPVPATAPQGLCPKCVLSRAATDDEFNGSATATAEIPSLERVAAAFPQLEVLELIGRGGMGFVFKARQARLERFVALKLLPDKLARDPRFAERFNREGRMLARLNHPNIVSIYDFGATESFYYLLMEYVDGVNLRQAMQSGRFSPAEALSIVPKICEALQYAHEQGILHRDIKPANILLDSRGHVKIADFGIAKLVGEERPDVTLTATGMSLGTPHYMAPEQLEKPSEVDHRADIYSLGVVFYEMLTGELPIGRFAAPSSRTPVGTNVDEVVFRTLEKDRERRFQSAGEMKTQVEHLSEDSAGGVSQGRTLPGLDHVSTSDRTTSLESQMTQTSTQDFKNRMRFWLPLTVSCALLVLVLIRQYSLHTRDGIVPNKQVSTRSGVDGGSQGNGDALSGAWIRFTFTALEVRQTPNGRWLAIDYLDDVHGQVQKAFPWQTTIPDWKAQVTTSEFLKQDPGSPPVRHQRVEYLLPESLSQERVDQLRAELATTLQHKSVRLEVGQEALLFELMTASDSSFTAKIKVIPATISSP